MKTRINLDGNIHTYMMEIYVSKIKNLEAQILLRKTQSHQQRGLP